MNALTGSFLLFFLAGPLIAGQPPKAKATKKETYKTPMAEVVKLIQDVRAKVVEDGEVEQDSYDKYTCWCEKTLVKKAQDISEAKEEIAKTETLIKKVEGQIASHGEEIAQLQKASAKNSDSQKETEAIREKDYSDYAQEKSESEQCIGALEAAIKVLTGTGAKRVGFLDTDSSSHEAQLIGTATSLRSVLRHRAMPSSISDHDLTMVKSFIDSPEHFASRNSLSAAQVDQNPFGDYAPQSTQIQGVLKGLYDAFTADLEKSNAAEAESQKSFETLMATKQAEQATLATTLDKQEAARAAKAKLLEQNRADLSDTQDQLEADEGFFAETKEACATKAMEWSQRTRLRIEELAGMNQAITILSSKSATDVFESAKPNFLQLAGATKVVAKQHEASDGKGGVYGKLKTLAKQFQSIGVAKIAVAARQAKSLEKVIPMIDDMISALRKEEADDIAHRDRCENAQKTNTDTSQDLTNQIQKGEKQLAHHREWLNDMQTDLKIMKTELRDTNQKIQDLLDFRNKEVEEFKQALKDKTDAIALLRQAIAALSKFYKNNKIPLGFAQKLAKGTQNPEKSPGTSWSGSGYGGRKTESGGILEILSMLVEDLQKDVKDLHSDDAEAQADQYGKQNSELQKSVAAQEQKIADLEDLMTSKNEAADDTDAEVGELRKASKSEDQTKKALHADCAWVESHFKTRRDKRKDEINGLNEAKMFVSQVVTGQDPLPPMGIIQKNGKVNRHSFAPE